MSAPSRHKGFVARRLVGSNQYRERRRPDLPGALRCGEVWGTECRAWVGPPSWSHGKHPTERVRRARAQDSACPPALLVNLAGDPDPQVGQLALANPGLSAHWRALGQL